MQIFEQAHMDRVVS
uniref:Uncharacterized protein n=1 Tax=Anguilla anguilla TaxID=7936 RepID=A0A0E9TBX3_ANGAN